MGRLLVGLVVQTLVLTALVMAPALLITGGVDWRRGWMVVGVLFLASAAGGLWMLRTSPELTAERARLPSPTSAADRRATGVIALAVVGWFGFAALDALRLRLLPAPAAVTLALGAIVFLAGLGAILWTFRVNAFAATVVKVEAQRGHQVIDTGPYALVRHPMYLGSILFFAGLGLLLDATAAALAAIPLFALAFLPRMVLEEAVLTRELPGYADYRRRVRARLAPGLF
ncbi:MAG TPA: isoprenylcysteine carboxylmethyltransferase family protein [Phenylobacterium sp.]